MAEQPLVYVGTYTEAIKFGTGEIYQGKGAGIYRFRMDPSTGAFEKRGCTEGVVNPSYLTLHPEGKHLYAVNEMKEYGGMPTGTVSSFAVDRKSGELTFLNKQPTHGTDPCHVIADLSGKSVLVANFASGSFAAFPVKPDGSLAEAAASIRHRGSSINQARQAGPHTHSVALDETNNFAYVADLGLDRVMIYRIDPERGKMTPVPEPWFPVKPGAGPRHFCLHRSGRYLYLINELDSTIVTFERNKSTGALREIQVVSTLPDGFTGENSCADIHITPDGSFLYGSNRGDDSIVIFRVEQKTGLLQYVGHEPTGGKTPRNFAIGPWGSYLYAANQNSDTIVHFKIDRQTGKLEATGDVTAVPTPVCIKLLV